MGKVIFNADDFGYSYGVNYGIIEAYRRGILTSTTLMANMPGFEHAAELHREYPELGIGVHLTLTCGRPLLDSVQSLTDETGVFKKLAFYEKPFQVDGTELYAEWDAQIQKVYRAGISPTHLDSHHHAHTFGQNQDVVVALAKKYDLPVRGNFSKKDEVRHTSYFEAEFDEVGKTEVDGILLKEPMELYLEHLLEKMRQEESTEIMCHTAYIDTALLEGSSFVYPRLRELEFLMHSHFAQTVWEDTGIELTTYRAI